MAIFTTDGQKSQILTLKGLGVSSKCVAKIVKVDHTTVNRIYRRYQKPRIHYAPPIRTGCPRKMLPSDDRYAALALARMKFGNATRLQQEFFPDLHPETVRRHLRALGLMARRPRKVPLLNRKHRKARRSWANKHRLWEAILWARVIFSDESKFNLFSSDGPRYVWRYAGEAYDARYTQKMVKHGGGHVMVWGCITSKGVGRLYRIDSTLTAKKYVEILNEALLGTLSDHRLKPRSVTFQQDNDPKHTAGLTRAWLESHDLSPLPWPSSSPDMNIIEHVWGYLDRKVHTRAALPQNTDELWKALEEEWYCIDKGLIDNLRECTHFEVPLDWHNDQVGKASLAMIRYPAIKQPKLGTLFMNPGGPGGSGVGTVQGPDGDIIMQHSGGNYDLVSWDPRAVGKTIPRTACFGSVEEEVAFWNGSFIIPGPEVKGGFTAQSILDDFYGQVDKSDDLLRRIGEQCVAYNPDMFQYVGTAATVRDMVAMHDALEGSGKPINFWGMSYGTIVGMYFVNKLVRSYSTAYNPAHEWLENALESTEATFNGFAEACAKAGPSKCFISQQNSTAASVRQWTRDLIEAAYDYRQKVGPSALITSAAIRNLLFAGLYKPQLWSNMSLTLHALKEALDDPAAANLTQAKRWLPDSVSPLDDQLKPRAEPSSNQTTSAYAYDYEAVTCSDAAEPEIPMFGPVGIPRIARPLCHRWPVRAVERYAGPWNKTLSNTILVIGNTADPVTPYKNAKWVADTLGCSAVLIEQGGYGHVSRRMPSNCTISAVQKYLVHNELPEQDTLFCETSYELFSDVASLDINQ
ncbi:similar to GF20795 [Rhizoctonia solani]|uniref:Similar to GF20795 n=1 Tax=Rhizoctonia solani TaxID=456999 RepID=A0A0K6GEM1_9AGAM|nr:similar to GF20795 [Rhizoctonia solani]